MHAGRVVGAAVPARELPGHERHPARPTHRLGISAGEKHPLAGDSVDVRRVEEGVACEARAGVGHVIHEDEHDVGPAGRGLGGMGRGQECEQKNGGNREDAVCGHHCFSAFAARASTSAIVKRMLTIEGFSWGPRLA